MSRIPSMTLETLKMYNHLLDNDAASAYVASVFTLLVCAGLLDIPRDKLNETLDELTPEATRFVATLDKKRRSKMN